MTRDDYSELIAAVEDMKWDAAKKAVEEYAREEFGGDDVLEVDTEDVTARVWSLNGVRDGDEPKSLDETVKGTKDLVLRMEMNRDPEVVGTVDGKEIARADAADVLDVDLYMDDIDVDVDYETMYRETPSYDASIGGWLTDERAAGTRAVVSGNIYMGADAKINAQKFIEMNRDALEKAGFSEKARSGKERRQER